MQAKIGEWLRRYLALEIVATIAALAGGLGAALVTANPLTIAFAGTWSENAGYYGYALWRELRATATVPGAHTLPPAARTLAALRRLLWEFGAAEAIDSFLARPFCLYWGVVLLDNMAAGLIAGKIAADVLFYGVAIAFYEAGKRHRS